MQPQRQWNDGGRRPGGRGSGGYHQGGGPYPPQGRGGYGQHVQGQGYGQHQVAHGYHQGGGAAGWVSHNQPQHQPYPQHQGKAWGKGATGAKGKGGHRGHPQQQQQQQHHQQQGSRIYQSGHYQQTHHHHHDNRQHGQYQRDKPKTSTTTMQYGICDGICGVYERTDKVSWISMNPTLSNIIPTWASRSDDSTFPTTASGSTFSLNPLEGDSEMDLDENIKTKSETVINVIPFIVDKPTSKSFLYPERVKIVHLNTSERVGSSVGKLMRGYHPATADTTESSFFDTSREILKCYGFPEEYYNGCTFQLLCEATFEDRRCINIIAHYDNEESVSVQCRSNDAGKKLIISSLTRLLNANHQVRKQRYFPHNYPDQSYELAYELALVVQQIEECLSRKFGRYLMKVIEAKKIEHEGATVRAQQRAKLLSEFNIRRQSAEQEEKIKWEEETCDATDDARDAFLKEKKDDFAKIWDDLWTEESKILESEPVITRVADQTLATWIDFLEPVCPLYNITRTDP